MFLYAIYLHIRAKRKPLRMVNRMAKSNDNKSEDNKNQSTTRKRIYTDTDTSFYIINIYIKK